VYAYPTVRKLAEHVEGQRKATLAPESKPSSVPLPENVARKPGAALVAAQMTAMLFMMALLSLPLIAIIPPIASLFYGRATILETLAYVAAISFALWPVMIAFGIGSKWLIIGRYRAGAHPLYGRYYFRWWLVSRLQTVSGAGLLIGTPLMPLYYRLMGAKVGRNCALDTAHVSAWDLVSIGDDTSIGSDTQLLGCRVENGHLILGTVDIGSRCFVGLHSAFGLNVTMGDGASLDDQSFLPDGEQIPQGEGRRGSPARKAEVAVPETIPLRPSKARIALFTTAQILSAFALAFLVGLPGLAFILMSAQLIIADLGNSIALILAGVPLLIIIYCFWIAACKAMVLRHARPGVYPLHGITDLRYWLAAGLMRAARGLMLPIFTTIYLPPWMRLLGARIGKHSEMSTIFSFLPDLLTVGDGSFFADGSILGGRRTNCGRFEVAANVIGKRSFIGNSAILPPGASIGDRCLIGVLSTPPERSCTPPDGTDWLGSPGFQLPNREKVDGFDDTVTYVPTTVLYAQRAVIDSCRILIPAYTGTAFALAGIVSLVLAYETFGIAIAIAFVPALALAFAATAVLLVVGLKWAVMGKFKPVIKPLWSPYVWLNEMVNGAYESIMAPVVAVFSGTPVAPFLLRLLGCKIGRHCYIGTALFSEFDLVSIGDHAALNGGAIIQNHLFEDRIMKSSYLTIGDRCSVGPMGVVLYDARMEEGAVLGSMSLLMKGEVMPAHSRWHGIPTVQG
jgi:non-ribosomal peptide synthetase-like protein